ncbi:MAG: histidine triad nucleotide-binding protein [Gammaproteobacteria bacterium]|nr:histidine triad nucleotide-binding protein [Gammaproteobacteria bacterium]MDH3374393.1 histidine triad nucleotide-binding protein [Gammaproteobacteria bacterium]MDH3409874.1 histidine triad nucleotide-binding protein [Gammaproteobacteria bacterium]MDH3552577.1 histidine triad nucleotide-binding protein [Gammaproteobacteria bacterium]
MTASDCLFCRILEGEIPADVIYESDSALAFRDINPQAPTHVLIIPRRHITTINDLDAGDAELVGSLFVAAKEVARQEGLADDGYRTVMNCGEEAGQSVFHIHLHLLGGRLFNWPPG